MARQTADLRKSIDFFLWLCAIVVEAEGRRNQMARSAAHVRNPAELTTLEKKRDLSPVMYFRQLLHEDRSCASYLVGCPTLGVCAVVDPQGEPSDYIERLQGQTLKVTAVIETHLHADHVSCARELARLSGVPLYLGPGAEVAYPHSVLHDGQVIPVGNRRIEVMHTPGHTPEHVALRVDEWFVLTGDTLFVGDVGRVDLSHDDDGRLPAVPQRAEQLYDSLQRLLALPDWTEVYPGHYAGSVCGRGMDGKPVSTIGRERVRNNALRLDRREFVDFQCSNLPPLPQDFHRIKAQNLGHA
jgi:glyoxylase-like metal-dependent hydrolase (beta-lactamase superfamily II)